MFGQVFDIPDGLLDEIRETEDINILIGENGSGKSSVLNRVAHHYINSHCNKRVVAIANTIHDKFDVRNTRFTILKSSSGKSIAKNSLKSALKHVVSSNSKTLYSISKALEYVQFDTIIGIRIKSVKHNYETINESNLEPQIKSDLGYCLGRMRQEKTSADQIFKIYLYTSNTLEVRDSILMTLIRYEKDLKKLKVIGKSKFSFPNKTNYCRYQAQVLVN
jgi:energy-coupling factor transporter ATP-binding protein EcfA2